MVHSLIKDYIMRKFVLAAAAVTTVFALSACKGEEAAPEATETAAAVATDAAAVATDAAAVATAAPKM